MEIKKIALYDLIKTIEEQCSKSYPYILEDIQLCIIKIKYLLPKMLDEIRILNYLAVDKATAHVTISRYAQVFRDLDERELHYIDKKSIINFLKSFKALNQTKIFLHSLEHIQFSSQSEANISIKNLQIGINNLSSIFDELKNLLYKNSQIYFYFNEKIEYITTNVKRFSEELHHALRPQDFENYYLQFNTLYSIYTFTLENMGIKDYINYVHLKKEAKLLAQKLKILLEYPKFLAFEYINFHQEESDLSQSISLNKRSNFKTIVNYLKDMSFVENYLQAFSIEDVIEAIRILHNYEIEKEDPEYSEKLTLIYYDEQVFLDMTADYFNIVSQLKAIDNENFKTRWKICRDQHQGEYNSLKEIGEKIYDFSLKLFKYSMFNKNFNAFREEMQAYFYKEFDQIIDLYY